MTVNIGQKCVVCHEDTQFGSGRFVNRIPAEDDKYEGYLCFECQCEECDQCKELTADNMFNDDGDNLCEDCYIEQVKKGLTSDKYGILEEETICI